MTWYTCKPVSLDRQLAFLKLRNPNGNGKLFAGTLRWHYNVQPTPLSRNYQLLLTFRRGGSPHVHVVAPDLRALAQGRDIPHVYDQEAVRLCLYLPMTAEWHSGLLLADTLTHWSALWLFFFEEWLLSDHWKGGGVAPPAQDREEWASQNVITT